MREGGSKKLNGRLPFVFTSYQLQLGTLCVFYPNVYFLFHIIGMIKRDILLPVLRIHGTILRIQGSSSVVVLYYIHLPNPSWVKWMTDYSLSWLIDQSGKEAMLMNTHGML